MMVYNPCRFRVKKIIQLIKKATIGNKTHEDQYDFVYK